MTTKEALLRSILLHPDEDGPRLAYADLIQEEGDEDRAKFIQYQIRHPEASVRIHRSTGSRPVCTPSGMRVGMKYRRPATAAIQMVKHCGWYGDFIIRRGFADEAYLGKGWLELYFMDVFRHCPLRELRLYGCHPAWTRGKYWMWQSTYSGWPRRSDDLPRGVYHRLPKTRYTQDTIATHESDISDAYIAYGRYKLKEYFRNERKGTRHVNVR